MLLAAANRMKCGTQKTIKTILGNYTEGFFMSIACPKVMAYFPSLLIFVGLFLTSGVAEAQDPIGVTTVGNIVPLEAPDISVIPTSHNFGEELFKNDHVSQEFTVFNNGTTLTISGTMLTGPDASEFNIDRGGGSFSLMSTGWPQPRHTIVVSFNPTSLGTKRATLEISSNDPDENPLRVSLTGKAAAERPGPNISVTPSEYGFVPNSSTSSQEFVISNVGEPGSGQLNISNITLTGANASEFSVMRSSGDAGVLGLFNFSVPPGDSESIWIYFEPKYKGLKYARLEINSNDPDENPLRVNLSSIAAPIGKVTPSSYDFGKWEYKNPRGSHTFTVSNMGNVNLNISSITFSGANASEFNIDGSGGSFIVPPRQSHEIVVSFNPSSSGRKVAILEINNIDPDENPLQVSLSGVAEGPFFTVTPASHNYYHYYGLGNRIQQSFLVRNVGADTMDISGTLTGPDALEFIIDREGGSFRLTPGQHHEISVSFFPKSIGFRNATLEISNHDPDEHSLRVNLNTMSGLYQNAGLDFDGTSDYVDVSAKRLYKPDDNSLDFSLANSSSLTIEAWIKPDALTGVTRIFSTRGRRSAGYAFGQNDGKLKFTIFQVKDFETPTAHLLLGQWSYVAVVFDYSEKVVRFYVNGELVQSFYGNFPPSGSFALFQKTANIGRNPGGEPEYWEGQIDELRIWNIARTSAEIQAYANRSLPLIHQNTHAKPLYRLTPSSEPGLVAYYLFDPVYSDIKIAGNNAANTPKANTEFLMDHSGNRNYGFLKTFALTGSSSNYVRGYSINDQELQIGDEFAGGIVFYVAKAGEDLNGDGKPDLGLVAASEDQKTFFSYPIGPFIDNVALAIDLCDNLSLNDYPDWFLPSPQHCRLMNIFLHGNGLGGFVSGGRYLTSDSTNPWTFNGNEVVEDPSVLKSYVRAVRVISPCTDGVQNNGEYGVDCGGNCSESPTPGSCNCTIPELRSVEAIPDMRNEKQFRRTVLQIEKNMLNYEGDDCFQYPIAHVQAIAALPDRGNGKTYWAITASMHKFGWLAIIEADGLMPESTTGRVIWAERFDANNQAGQYNHPGDVEIVNNTLVVALQNWKGSPDFGCPLHFPDNRLDSQGRTVVSLDAVGFYDLSNPQSPEFMGKLDANQLLGKAREISSLSLFMAGPGQIVMRVHEHYFLSEQGAVPNKSIWTRLKPVGTISGGAGNYRKEGQYYTVEIGNGSSSTVLIQASHVWVDSEKGELHGQMVDINPNGEGHQRQFNTQSCRACGYDVDPDILPRKTAVLDPAFSVDYRGRAMTTCIGPYMNGSSFPIEVLWMAESN